MGSPKSSLEKIKAQPHTEFKLEDDDGVIYYYGLITLKRLNGPEQVAFAPLDYYMGHSGCTVME